MEELPDDDERPRKRKRRDEDDRDDRREEREDRRGRGRATGGGLTTILLIALGGYAFLVTALAVYGLFFKSGDTLERGHPLSTIPDNFGEFDPATRKKVSMYKFPVDGDLPAELRAPLGGKVLVGEVEIKPVRIEKRKLLLDVETPRGEKREEVTPAPAFVLTLDIKNTSSDLNLFPMDPAFTRRGAGDDKPITRLVVSKSQFFAGGFIQWPLDPGRIKKRTERQQANDATPLKPNEAREYVVFTDARPDIVKAVEGAKDAMQWRVQVRRAPVQLRGKEVPVTAIVGVDFKASDIKGAD